MKRGPVVCSTLMNHLLVYAEALDTLGHAIEFVAPEDASYAAILLNDNATAVDVAVQIRLSPPMVEACV
jgi:hypothetical protein